MLAVPFGYPNDIPAHPFASEHPSGLNPPKYPAGTVCGFLSDHPEVVEILPEPEWDDYLLAEDEDDAPIEQWVHIKSQRNAGSCATESTVQDEEIIEQFQGNEFVRLNPWFMYYYTRSGSNGGSSHDENLAFLRANGCAPVSVWSRSMGWQRKPSEEAHEAAKVHKGREFYQVRTWEEFGSCLIARKGTIFGYPGHSILAVRLRKNKRKIKYANSWDTTWGNQGYGDVDRNDIVWGYGVYVVLNSIRHVA